MGKDVIVVHFWVIHMEELMKVMALKAPGNYSDQFWSNKILVCLCEGRNSPNSLFPEFWTYS